MWQHSCSHGLPGEKDGSLVLVAILSWRCWNARCFSSAISESSSFEASLGAAQVPYFFLPGAAQVPALLLIYIYTNVISGRPTYIFQFFYMFLLWCLMRPSLNVMRRGLKLRSCLSDSVLSKVWLPWCCTSTFDNINQRCHAQCISVYCLKQAGEIGHAKLNIRKPTPSDSVICSKVDHGDDPVDSWTQSGRFLSYFGCYVGGYYR